jgi:hypothetical protein
MYAIIIGANKAGSTSLFRYLSSHPEIRPARVKEANFFSDPPKGDDTAVRAAYDRIFEQHGEGRIALEASPNYLRCGAPMAEMVGPVCDDARLMVILREPAARLLSYFRSNRESQFKPDVARIDLPDYVTLVEEVSERGVGDAPPGPRRNAWHQYQRGCYAKFLTEYLHFFEPEQLCVLFFDELAKDPRALMTTVTRFLGIDPGYFETFDFVVENRTRAHRSRPLQAVASRVNLALEPVLNRVPGVRRGLRHVYELVNERQSKGGSSEVSAEVRHRLEAVFEPSNRELATLLAERFPQVTLPSWLRFDAST